MGWITPGGDVQIRITGDLENLNSAMVMAEKEVNNRFGRITQRAGMAMTAFGGLVTAGFGMAIGKSMEFGTTMSKMATLGVTDLDGMGKGIMDLSTKLGFNMVEAADKAYDAVSSGMPADAYVLALEPAARAAIAGVGSLSDSIDAGMGVMSAYGLHSKDTAVEVANFERVLNSLTVATLGGKVTFKDMGDELGRVAPLTAQVGMSIEQFGAVLATSTSYGLKSSEALTGLKATLQSVLNPSEQAIALTKGLGLQWDVTTLKSKGVVKFFQEARTAMEGHNAALVSERENLKAEIALGKVRGPQLAQMKARVMELKDVQSDWEQTMAKTVGSSEALNFILGMTSQNGLRVYEESLKKASENQKTFWQMSEDAMRNDPSLGWRLLGNEIQRDAIIIGKMLQPALMSIVPQLTGWLKWVAELTAAHPKLATNITLGVAALGVFNLAVGPLLIALPKLIGAVNVLWGLFSGSTVVGAILGSTFATVTIAAGALAVSIGVVAGALYAYKKAVDAQEEAAKVGEHLYTVETKLRNVLKERGIVVDENNLKALEEGQRIDYLTKLYYENVRARVASGESASKAGDASTEAGRKESALGEVVKSVGAANMQQWEKQAAARWGLTTAEIQGIEKMTETQQNALRSYIRGLQSSNTDVAEQTKQIHAWLDRFSLDHHESPSVNERAAEAFGTWGGMLNEAVGWAGSATGMIGEAFRSMVAQIGGLFDNLKSSLSMVFDWIGSAARNVMSYAQQAYEWAAGKLGFADGGVVPGYAVGGVTQHRVVMVGERGPELAALPVGTRIMSHEELRSVAGRGGGGGVGGGPVNVTIDMRGTRIEKTADADVVMRVMEKRLRSALANRGLSAATA